MVMSSIRREHQVGSQLWDLSDLQQPRCEFKVSVQDSLPSLRWCLERGYHRIPDQFGSLSQAGQLTAGIII